MENLKVDYKDRDEKVMIVHTSLRAVGLNVDYITADLIHETIKKANELGDGYSIRDTTKIQLDHEDKWAKYFTDKDRLEV